MGDELRRAADQGAMAIPKIASRTFWEWVERRHIPAHMVIAVTIWLTVRVVEWAMDFPSSYPELKGTDAGLIIGAVMAPWGLMEAAMFKFYSESIKNGSI